MVAAVGVMLGSEVLTPSAQTTVAGHSRAGGSGTGGSRAGGSVTRFAWRSFTWAGFAGNPQHMAYSNEPPQPMRRIRWRAKVDLAPVLTGGSLAIHYGSPMITTKNTVLIPTRVSAKTGFRMVAYSGTSGARRWSLGTDYRPVRGFSTSALPAALTPGNTLTVAGAGGTVLMRGQADKAVGAVRRRVFYGAAQWKAHQSAYDKAVKITTPLTAGPDGSVYFGFTVHGATPAHLSSGIARIDAHGHATWITAATAAGNRRITGVAIGCAPALSPDGTTVYIAVTRPYSLTGLETPVTTGILIGLNATTLKPRFHVVLKDPASGQPAAIFPGSSASPTVGPDGDVYYGIEENPFQSHDDRGWLLHYNATLTRTKIPGAFGSDDTVSVLPASAVPGYHGTSPYLLVAKYNNYYIPIPGGGKPLGNGHNEVAVLDPRSSQKDLYTNAQVMKAVQTILSPVHSPGDPPGARYEWCINSAVADLADDSVFVNNEDGILYRWDLASNTLAEKIHLNHPRGEAYTPTLIGPDGTTYAINNATIYAIGR